MARRSTPSPPEIRSLGVLEMQNGIERLTRRVEELKAFDPQSVSRHGSSEIVSLKTAIEDTLAAVFGQGTPKFKRYRPAFGLALQLFFCFEVRALSGSLVSSTPE